MSRQQREKEAHQFRRLNLMAAVALLPLAAVVVGLHVAGIPTSELTAVGESSDVVETHLDPNAAPWWDLTCLPGIGESRARAIVEYRELVRRRRGHPEAVVFRHAEDLQTVKGVGPKTAACCAPYLDFPPE